MPTPPDLAPVFEPLRAIMHKHTRRLTVKADTPDNFYVEAGYSEKYRRTLSFGAVQIKKNYVSYHLMPVYMFPELLADLSPALKKRMQGKACFNFKAVDKALFAELAALTRKSAARIKRADWV